MTFEPPVVVVAEGLEGLRAAAWLASLGAAVRVLFVGPIPAPDVEPLLSGEEGRLAPIFGALHPTTERPALHLRTGLEPVPSRLRDVAALAGKSRFGLVREWWSGERRLPRDLGGWGRQRFGPTAWDHVVAPIVAARTGTAVDGLHRGLGPLLTSRPDGPWWEPVVGGDAAVARWVDAVRDADGEVLDHVDASAFEVEDGRVVAVVTDHGREHVGTCVTDVGPQRFAAWLPDRVPPPVAVADTVEVEFATHMDGPAVILTEATRVVRGRVTFAGEGFAAWSDEALAERAHTAAAGLAEGPVLRIVRRPGQVPRPVPETEGATYRWLADLAALGVRQVGPRALVVPLLPRDEVDTTVAILDGVPAVEVRGGRLGLTPSRPWVLAQ